MRVTADVMVLKISGRGPPALSGWALNPLTGTLVRDSRGKSRRAAAGSELTGAGVGAMRRKPRNAGRPPEPPSFLGHGRLRAQTGGGTRPADARAGHENWAPLSGPGALSSPAGSGAPRAHRLGVRCLPTTARGWRVGEALPPKETRVLLARG